MTRFVFLHGFTQTHHHWHDVAHRLAAHTDRPAALAFVDLPGHGLAADDVAGSIDTVGPRLVALAGAGTYVGYSMGGRIALVAAATGDARVERLVLIGATPGIADAAERNARHDLDETRARHLEEVGVDTFLDEWLAQPMFEGLPPDPAALAHRRGNTVAGLAHSLRSYGTGAQTPLWDALGAIEVPVLVLAGERDRTFTAFGEAMATRLPRGTFAPVPDAGHAAHSERPVTTAALIATWLADLSA